MNAALATSGMDWSLLLPAFLAGLLVLVTHVPLGARVLDKGIVFMDLAVAQMAGLGVIVAGALGLPEDSAAIQLAAGVSALLGAMLLAWTERRAPARQEALIGALFILAATGGLMLLARHPHGGEHLQELLAGQILWVSPAQVTTLAGLTAVLALVIGRFLPAGEGGWRFYAVFAVAVTASVQLVGVYLVFASLILPALATTSLTGWRRQVAGWAIGAAGYGGGLALSVWLDLPTGAVVAWALAASAGVFALARRALRAPAVR